MPKVMRPDGSVHKPVELSESAKRRLKDLERQRKGGSLGNIRDRKLRTDTRLDEINRQLKQSRGQ